MLATPLNVEILIEFNPNEVPIEIINEAVTNGLLSGDDGEPVFACRIEGGVDCHYYQLKNIGAQGARRKV
jgi:hypothetical protein